MKNKRIFLILIGLIFLCGALTFDATAQSSQTRKRNRRKKTTRVRTTIVNPNQVRITPQAASLEPEIVSTAEGSQTDENSTNSTQNTELSSGAATNQSTENTDLSNQVNVLNGKITRLQKERQSLSNLEKLSVAEERAENLRLQLANTIEKESNLKARLEQITYQSTPENIERDTAIIGSLRPEQVRESRRKMLEGEKKGISDQLVQIQTNRTKLETAIISADNLVERLRTAVETDLTANDDEPATNPGKPTTTPANQNSTGSQPQQ